MYNFCSKDAERKGVILLVAEWAKQKEWLVYVWCNFKKKKTKTVAVTGSVVPKVCLRVRSVIYLLLFLSNKLNEYLERGLAIPQ